MKLWITTPDGDVMEIETVARCTKVGEKPDQTGFWLADGAGARVELTYGEARDFINIASTIQG